MASKKPTKRSDDFKTIARRLECDEDKERFEKKLGKIARAEPKQAPARSSPKKGK